MNIGGAVEALKQGKKITRASWFGQTQFVIRSLRDPNFLIHHKDDGTTTPWIPNQDDILAENFIIF